MIGEWLGRIDLISLGIGAVVGSIVSFAIRHFLSRPLIEVCGGGGGGGVNGTANQHWTIRSVPGFVGIQFGPTIIAGRMLGQGWRFGVPFDRAPARDCTAAVIDDQTGEHVSHLVWRKNSEYSHTVTLGPGESAELFLFAAHFEAPGKYFVFRPSSTHPQVQAPGPNDILMEGTRSFTVEIRFSEGSQVKRLPIEIVQNLNDRYSVRTPHSGGTFT